MERPEPTSPSLVVVGHGTRCQAGVDQFLGVVRLIRQLLPHVEVRHAFLELVAPDLEDVLDQVAREGNRQIVVSPLLLLAAGHVKNDLCPRIARFQEQHVSLSIRLSEPLGLHPLILDLSVGRFQQAIDDRRWTADECLLLIVGRGTRDRLARQQFEAFVARRKTLTSVGQTEFGYMARAHPTLDEAIARAVRSPLKKVIAQPHLLFPGELLTALQRRISEQDEVGDRQQWVVARPLGCETRVAKTVIARFHGTSF